MESKNQVYDISKKCVTNIECIKNKFETIVKEVMQQNNYKFFDGSDDINSKYYYPPFFLEIFREIQNEEKRELKITIGS